MMNVKRDVPATMRDGNILYADIYYPEGKGPFPAILMRLPYDKTNGQDYVYAHPSWFARQGYLVVVQDTRGRWKSEGDFYPFRHEMTDGYDTVEWVAGLPTCNGKVGMYGFSYVGATQLMAAVMQPPHLACICPAMTASQYYEGWTYNGGALALATSLSWAVELAIGEADRRHMPDLERELWNAFMNNMRIWYGYLPLNELPLLKETGIASYFFDWLDHPTYDEYWKRWSIDMRYDQITVPALFTAGWYDVFRDGTLKNYLGLKQSTVGKKTKNKHMLLAGPWYHVPWIQFMGDLDFGEDARNLVSDMHVRWFDYWLKGIDNGLMDEAPVRIFVMGENIWRSEEEWPPKGVHNVKYYLHSRGRANSLQGDGYLDLQVPGAQDPDVYVYNPRFPVPSLGGHACCFPGIAPMGPFDQRPVEVQNQTLVFTTQTLEEDIWVAGPVTASLWAASSAVDTDFCAKLIDVYPDGRAINLTEGIIRGRYRDSLEKASLLTPDEVYRFDIQLGNTCNVFKAGHHIRVEISSSNFPHWDRNPNTGNKPGTESYTDLIVATQRVFHDGQRPSHITLPVISR